MPGLDLYALYQLHVAGCPRCVTAGASMRRCSAGRQLRRAWVDAERTTEEHPLHAAEHVDDQEKEAP